MELLNSLFLPMLAGHLIADFWLQPASWVNHKKTNGWKSGKLLIHSIIAAFLPVLFTLKFSLWWFIPIIFVTHYLTDILKSKLKENIGTFLLDQALHIAVLAILSFTISDITLPGNGKIFWIYATGFILITSPLGIITGIFLSTLIKTKSISSTKDVSFWIGILERILILIFIIVNQFSAIGFLIAAKSVFRFNEAKEGGNKRAEYFLLGTLASFTLAIAVGLSIRFAIAAS